MNCFFYFLKTQTTHYFIERIKLLGIFAVAKRLLVAQKIRN